MRLTSQVYAGLHTLWAHLDRRHRVPLSVYLTVTDACPNTCIYCNYPNRENVRVNELTTAQTLQLIDEMAQAGTRKLHLTGGEPLVRKDLGQIIERAKRKGLFVGASLSGILVPKRIDELKKLDIVFLSFDGEEEVHDYHRGKGSFQRVMAAMQALQEHGVKFWATTVLTRKNKESIDFILGQAEKKGFVANFVFLNYGEAEHSEQSHLPHVDAVADLAMDDQEMRATIRYLSERKRKGAPIGSSQEYFRYLLTWEDYRAAYRPLPHQGIDCWAGSLFAYVLPDGKVYSCGDLYWRRPGQDALALGFKEAFRRLDGIPCRSCRAACYIEQNLLFSLHWRTIVNWARRA